MAAVQSDKFIATFVFVAALLILFVQSVTSQSASSPNSHTYTYIATRSNYQCTQHSYYTCNWYWYRWYYWYPYWYGYYDYGWYCRNYWNYYYYGCYGGYYGSYCYNYYYNDCYYVDQTYTATGYACNTGWQGSNCDVPVCSPACTNGRTCTAPNTCQCLSTKGCALQPCDNSGVNCYPGTCINTLTKTCQCPQQFSGTNCQTLSVMPEIPSCSASVTINGQANAIEGYCAGVGQTPFTVWLPGNVEKIEIAWQANYVNPVSMPNSIFVNYIANAPSVLGVAQSAFTISLDPTEPVPCSSSSPPTYESPVNIAQCANTYSDPGTLGALIHNQTIIISIAASNGGVKTGNPGEYGGSFQEQHFTGSPTTRVIQFQVDLKPPTHCLLNPNTKNNCSVFPIYLDKDMRTNPKIQPTFLGWTDDGSGISTYQVQVFYMQIDANSLLINIGAPLITSVITPDQQFSYTVNQPGMFSIELTVSDRANNSAMARKLFFYNDGASVTQGEQPFFMANTVTNTLGEQWINQMVTPQNNAPFQFPLSWAGHFVIDPRYASTWFKGAEQWPIQANVARIDDNYGGQYGMRSIDPITNITGITSYSLTYVVDHEGGRGVQEPNTSTSLTPSATNTMLSIPQAQLTDGDTIVVWLLANDVTGAAGVLSTLMVHFSRARPTITSQFFTVATDFSSVNLQVNDSASGISNISYVIYDNTLQAVIKSGVSQPVTRVAPSSKRAIETPCLPSDSTCYCIPTGYCYAVTQVIDINNCWIDQLASHNVEVQYTVTNGAGLTASGTLQLQDINKVVCRALSGGAVAGIVIACIIGLILIILLIILIVIMILNKRRGKPAMPQRFRTMGANIRTRFTHHFAGSDQINNNEVYEVKKRDTMHPGQMKIENEVKFEQPKVSNINGAYISNDDLTEANVARKRVQFGEKLAEGKFAVVRMAFLMRGNERTPVAAKALRNGSSKTDEDLMLSKISFLRGVPSHLNVVRLVGAIEDGSNEGPVMLLELCEMTLKDWLAKIKKVTSEHLENMLNFSLNIARGAEHLHSKQIIHRRLAIRNVLLKESTSGLVAKLIGFGPTKEDTDDKTTDTGAGTSVPLKWLAPETLDTLNKPNPHYDKKTDSWSFGITIWEMYSLGAGPYPDNKANEIKAVIKTGYRMSRPDECPPELFSTVIYPCWNDSPTRRPDFSTICRDIEKFRKGHDLEGTGYYAADDPQELYTNDEHYDEVYDDGR